MVEETLIAFYPFRARDLLVKNFWGNSWQFLPLNFCVGNAIISKVYTINVIFSFRVFLP
jgi:hypothetical protein